MKGNPEADLNIESESIFSARLKYVLQQLGNHPDWQQNFVATISELLKELSLGDELAIAGYHHSDSFIQELIFRLKEKLLPRSALGNNFSEIIYWCFDDKNMAIAIDSLDEKSLNGLFSLFEDKSTLKDTLKNDFIEAAHRLSLTLLQLTLQIHKEVHLTHKKLHDLDEYKLMTQLMGLKKADSLNSLTDEQKKTIYDSLSRIEKHIEESSGFTHTSGISTEMVYRFQLQRKHAKRLRILLDLMFLRVPPSLGFRMLLSHMIIDIHEEQSLRYFFYENFSFLIRRIVQGNSEIGSHYITFTWKDFGKMFASAGAGGAITTLTVYIKILMAKLAFTGFFKGFMESLNYSASFLLIQGMGGTLATKQPSTTAPFIAEALKTSVVQAQKTIVALLRTQFAAVLGNVAMVFPISFFIAFVASLLGHPLFTPDEAYETVQTSNLFGGTVIYATFTGVLLFAGSVIAGWIENFYVLNQVGLRLQSNPLLNKWAGEKRMNRISEKISSNLSSLAGNITLGFLLGLLPQVLKFFNLPLEVRHVTLATGQFAASLPQALKHGLSWFDVFNAVSGLALIGFLNLAISFLLALLLASFATNVQFKYLFELLKWGVKLSLTRPWLLFVPEEDSNEGSNPSKKSPKH